MQLFWGNFDIKKGFSYDANIFHQVKNVLRTKLGDRFLIHDEKTDTRYLVETTNLEKFFEFRIVEKIEKPIQNSNVTLVIGMLNKFEKIEFLVQKISEIGADIIFYDSERSQIHELNEKKLDRLKIISREALEQSKGGKMPKILFQKKLQNILEDKNFEQWEKYVLEFGGENIFETKNLNLNGGFETKKILFVGPEGGFSSTELEKFEKYGVKKISLGENIFRAETAGILGSYILKNI